MAEIELSQGTIHYREQGSGPPVLFLHGLLVNGRVWDRLLPCLGGGARFIVPDLPLGSHPQAMNGDADLSPRGLADLIAELITRLELQDVTLVGNDTGGALAQLVVAEHPELIGRLVLIDCDAFEHFPPAALRPLINAMARVPASLTALAALGAIRPVRGATMKLARLTVEPIPDALVRDWISPLRDGAVRRDVVKVLRGISPEHTLNAAERLRTFERPVLIVWGTRDVFFPITDAERLAALFPDAQLQLIDGARTFVQMDYPERLAELLSAFVATAQNPA